MALPVSIPTEVVLPMLSWIRNELAGGGGVDPALVVAYDIAAQEVGWPKSSEIVGRRLVDMMRTHS